MRTQIHDMGGPGAGSEATLFQQARAGCPARLNTLMDRHAGLVQAGVRRQVLGNAPFTEALQAGRISLWWAIPSTLLRTGRESSFDYERSVRAQDKLLVERATGRGDCR